MEGVFKQHDEELLRASMAAFADMLPIYRFLNI